MAQYIYRILSPRPDFVGTITELERATMGRHWVYLEGQFKAGKVQVVGRCVDGTYGITILEAASLEEARRFMAADPAVADGLMRAELHEFRLTLVQAPAK